MYFACVTGSSVTTLSSNISKLLPHCQKLELSHSLAPTTTSSSSRRGVSAGSAGQPHITGLVSRVGERLELYEVSQT